MSYFKNFKIILLILLSLFLLSFIAGNLIINLNISNYITSLFFLKKIF